MLKPKNIIIFVAALVILVLIYVFFIKKDSEENGLVTTSINPIASTTPMAGGVPGENAESSELLKVLLNVKNIKLDASIFSEPAFQALIDSSIVLVPDGTEGRPNPFAPIGSDSALTPPPNQPPSITPPSTPMLPPMN